MSEAEKVINDLNVIKLALCNPQLLTTKMRIRIGQAVTSAVALLEKQKRGHWVLDPDGMDWNIPAWCCSVCGCRNDNIPPNLEKTNPLRWSGSKFCPNCGAKMDEEVKQDD